jgi:hypothetical protein
MTGIKNNFIDSSILLIDILPFTLICRMFFSEIIYFGITLKSNIV